jgi:hypothetical protein
MQLQNSFLFRLFRRDKLIFTLVMLYVVGVLYHVLKQREEFPFFLYGMYSLKEPTRDNYVTYSVTIDTQQMRYAKLRDAQRELVGTTLTHALDKLDSVSLNGPEGAAFKRWFQDYCGDIRLMGDNRMNVYRLTCNYDKSGMPYILKKELVYTYGGPEQ